MTFLFHIDDHWRRASDVDRWAALDVTIWLENCQKGL